MAEHFYYKPSGKFSPTFFLYVLLIVFAAIPLISVAYIYLSYYTPIVYLKIFATIGCGIAIGFLMGFATRLGKVRNPILVLISTIAVMCIAKYVQWTVYIPLIFSDSYRVMSITFSERFLTSFYLLTEPGTVFELAGVINTIGAWSIGRGGQAVIGVSLLAVWIMEFITMTWAACIASSEKPMFPFCEKSNTWYNKTPNRVEANIPENFDNMKTDIENGRYDELIQLAKLAKDDNKSDKGLLSLLFYKPALSTQPYYLQIKRVRVNGGKKRESKMLLRYIAVDDENVRKITGTSLS
ncbi:MAG: hypothetical protein FWB78_12715 [Treponema sp.]|nr:hypothetical protein [Treponema sp.]